MTAVHLGGGFSQTTSGALAGVGLDPETVEQVIRSALAEDLRYGPDVTTAATVAASAVTTGAVVARRDGVLACGPVALAVLDAVLGPGYEIVSRLADGTALQGGQACLVVRARTRGLLTAERTLLNLVCHMSGIATATAAWVAAIAGTGAVVRDTRKTLPGLRMLEKYSVRCGGGVNHRMGLGDAVLIKDNHVAAAGSITAAIKAVRAYAPRLRCQAEVDTLGQFDEAVEAGAEEILLDNFTAEQCAEAVRRARRLRAGVRLEASGGLTLERARQYAESGVDYLAVGAITHSSPALDLALDL